MPTIRAGNVNVPIIPANSGSRNPCPSGEGLCTTNINGTDFLICSASCYKAPNISLAIGLSLGIPLSLACIVLFLKCAKDKGWFDAPSGYNNFTPGILYRIFCCCRVRRPPQIQTPFIAPHEVVSEELSPEALRDFQNGNLGDLLKKELMILRIRHGRDLTEYVKYAELSKQPEIAAYCQGLNPTTIPREIREEAIRTARPMLEV